MSEEGMDLSGAMDMLKNMLSSEDGQQQIQNILSAFGEEESQKKESEFKTGAGEMNDLEMIMKIQRAMELMNRHQDSQQTKLLEALRPFLKEERKEKLDRAMKLMKFGGLFEIMREVREE